MINASDLSTLLKTSTRHALLDVRERAAYERGHIYRATSLPRRLLESRVPRLVTARATPIVLYDGNVGALAAKTLGAMGYTDVRVLDGGLAAWRAAGGRIVQGLNVPSKVFGEQALHRSAAWRRGPPPAAPSSRVGRHRNRSATTPRVAA